MARPVFSNHHSPDSDSSPAPALLPPTFARGFRSPRDVGVTVAIDKHVRSNHPNENVVDPEIVQDLSVDFQVGSRTVIRRESVESGDIRVRDHHRHVDKPSSVFRRPLPDRRLVPIRFDMPHFLRPKLKM